MSWDRIGRLVRSVRMARETGAWFDRWTLDLRCESIRRFGYSRRQALRAIHPYRVHHTGTFVLPTRVRGEPDPVPTTYKFDHKLKPPGYFSGEPMEER